MANLCSLLFAGSLGCLRRRPSLDRWTWHNFGRSEIRASEIRASIFWSGAVVRQTNQTESNHEVSLKFVDIWREILTCLKCNKKYSTQRKSHHWILPKKNFTCGSGYPFRWQCAETLSPSFDGTFQSCPRWYRCRLPFQSSIPRQPSLLVQAVPRTESLSGHKTTWWCMPVTCHPTNMGWYYFHITDIPAHKANLSLFFDTALCCFLLSKVQLRGRRCLRPFSGKAKPRSLTWACKTWLIQQGHWLPKIQKQVVRYQWEITLGSSLAVNIGTIN